MYDFLFGESEFTSLVWSEDINKKLSALASSVAIRLVKEHIQQVYLVYNIIIVFWFQTFTNVNKRPKSMKQLQAALSCMEFKPLLRQWYHVCNSVK